MQLRFIYAPGPSLPELLPFYRDELGLSEAWREGEHTVAFQLPDSDVQVMVVGDEDIPPGPMYQIDSVAGFLKAKPHFKVCLQPREIPDGWVAGVEDPAGNVIYVFDQTPGS